MRGAAALPLADGCDAACAFVNAEIDRAVVEGLVKRGIKVLAKRCAGYNNVDFKAAYEAGLMVVRVPASLSSTRRAAGDVFYADYAKPQGFCDEAWKAIYQYVFALAHGADKSLFYYGDWIKKPGVAIVSCNDGLRPVIMKLEATDEEANIDARSARCQKPGFTSSA